MNIVKSVYFDTNIFRCVAHGDISQIGWRRMIELTDQNQIKRFVSPVTIAELGSHIVDEEREQFPYFQGIFKIIKNCCNHNMLRDPNSLLKYILSKGYAGKINEAENFPQILDMIVGARDYDGLVNGQEWPELNFRGKLNAHFIKEYRDKAEAAWIDSLYNDVIKFISPEYTRGDVSTYKISDPEFLSEALDFLEHDGFKIIFLQSLMTRCGIGVPSSAPFTSEDFHFLEPLDGAFHFYKYLLKKMYMTGYKPEKPSHKNDFNDFHLLFYLGLGKGFCFVSQEKQFMEALNGSSHSDQYKTFDEFIDSF